MNRNKRSSRMVDMALKKINVIDDNVLILEENTGLFVIDVSKTEYHDKENIVPRSSIIPSSPCQSESEPGTSGSSFRPSESSEDSISCCESDDSSMQSMNKLLDETSGLISKRRAKKGKGKPETWIRNKTKAAREHGKSYHSIERKKGKGVTGLLKREERKLQPRCESKKCALMKTRKCNVISEEERKAIFKSFWHDLSWDQRKGFVNTMVEVSPSKLNINRAQSRRNKTLKYYLMIENERVSVCKKMFLGTLSLGEWTVLNWVKNRTKGIGIPKRECQKVEVKKNTTKRDDLRKFLELIPKMPSHYCRQKTDKLYVDMTYTSMRDLYRCYESYSEDNNCANQKGSYGSFLNVVHDMNIGIFTPKKDQCDTCYAYKNKNIPEEEYRAHIKQKDRAREEKNADKETCRTGGLNVFTMDVQAVQMVPQVEAGAQYFKQKLCCHQFTIYNLKDGSVACYVWHEGEAGMDANMFASCVINFLEQIQDKSIPIVIFSDGCCAQNRNVTLANALQHFSILHNATVHQKYLVVGHTQMECDSVHATIETRKKKKELYVPADFVRIIKEARKSDPYKVHYVDHTFFKEYSKINYYKSIRPGSKRGDPCVVDVRAFKYCASGLYYKLNFEDDWEILPRRMTRGFTTADSIPNLYGESIPITLRKYNDLQSLKRLLPSDYQPFYEQLKHE